MQGCSGQAGYCRPAGTVSSPAGGGCGLDDIGFSASCGPPYVQHHRFHRQLRQHACLRCDAFADRGRERSHPFSPCFPLVVNYLTGPSLPHRYGFSRGECQAEEGLQDTRQAPAATTMARPAARCRNTRPRTRPPHPRSFRASPHPNPLRAERLPGNGLRSRAATTPSPRSRHTLWCID